MKRLHALLFALLLLTVSAAALEPVERPIVNGGYTYYAIDGGGTLWAWGDSFHGGITAEEDPVLWENAVPEVQNAQSASAGFVTGVAVDRDGVLWGFGCNILGHDTSQGAVQLMDHVVYAEAWIMSGCALKDDGTLWLWGGRDPETGEENLPYQAMDHVRAFCGGHIQLEDGTWVERRSAGDGEPLVVPVAVNVAEMRDDYATDALLMLGEDGNLYRAARKEGWYDAPELLLEQVVSFSGSTAVTADGTFWAWGDDRPAMLKNGAPDPVDPYDRNLSNEELAAPVRIMEGVRCAEAGEGCTLAILEDGSLWELPSAYHLSIWAEYPPERFPEVRTECRKLLDQAAPVQWFSGDPDAPAPVLLEMPEALGEKPETEPPVETQEEMPEEAPAAVEAVPAAAESGSVPWAALAASLLPLLAAVCFRWKKRP